MGRDVPLEVDARGRTTVPIGDRKALGIDGNQAILDCEVEVLEVQDDGENWSVENLPDPVLNVLTESQISELRNRDNTE